MVDFLNALRNLHPVAQIVGVVGVALIWIAGFTALAYIFRNFGK